MSDVVPFALRTACLRLLLYLHIDVDPFIELRVPRTSRLLSEIEASSVGNAKLSAISFKQGKAQQLKAALVKYLKVRQVADARRIPLLISGDLKVTLLRAKSKPRRFQ